MNNKKIGILDPLGLELNPLTNTPYSDNYKSLTKNWTTLPSYEEKIRDQIFQSIKNNQVILIISGTGSGKTVLIPKYVLHVLDYNKKIAVTLPKQILAESQAKYAAATLDVTLGKEVGYQYKGSPSNSRSSGTKLLYATDGSIVAQLLKDPSLSNFDAVIIDEAHERKVQIDFLLLLLKTTIKMRPEFKLIIMSATVNQEIFTSYFYNTKFDTLNISGQSNYPIKSHFADKHLTYEDSLEQGFQILLKILKEDIIKDKPGAHDVLFFINSKNIAYDMCKRLNLSKSDISKQGDVFCIEVFSGIDDKKSELAQDENLYKRDSNYTRKIVFSTNVAESSLTIKGIKYVIDSGYELKSYYDPVKRANVLDRQLITHAQAKQRMGRAGRTEPGVCYHMYSKEDFELNMDRYPEPEIRLADISGECLKFMNLENVQTVENLLKLLTELIEPPKEKYIKDAIMKINQSGLIKNNKINKLGSLVSQINPDILIGKSIVYSKLTNCMHEMIDIVCMLDSCKNTISDIFTYNNKANYLKKKNNKKELQKLDQEYKKIREKFRHKYGDHLTILNIYKEYRDSPNKDSFCEKNMINMKILSKAKKYREVMKNNLRDINFQDLDIYVNPDILNLSVDKRIMFSLYKGFSINTATKLNNSNLYKLNYVDGVTVSVDRNSFVNDKKSKNIIYCEHFHMINTKNLNVVSSIPKFLLNF